MSSRFGRFLANIERGMNGENEGLPIDMPALENFVPNLQRKHYYLVGGNTGSGKTTFVMDKLFLTPLEHIMYLNKTKTNDKNLEIEAIFNSYEIDVENIIAKAISRRIYLDTKMVNPSSPKSLNVNYILSRGKNRISQEDYELVRGYDDYWDFFEDNVTWVDVSQDPNQIKAAIHEMALRNGKLMATPDGKQHIYYPNNPNKYLLCLIDHLALADQLKGDTLTETMKEISKSIVKGRNLYGLTGIVIQQLNMDLFDPARVKIGRLAPTLSDFGDAKTISRDVEVVIALHNPVMFSQPSYSGYDINILKNNFRSIEVLKNRYGESDKKVGVYFNGAVGLIKELPGPLTPEMGIIYQKMSK